MSNDTSIVTQPQRQEWQPIYSRWRHGGWYVHNVRHLNDACGCVSNNYPDGRWRIVCDGRRKDLGGDGDFTYPTRDAAARAELALVEAMKAKAAQPKALGSVEGNGQA
jgi:hypothetical protein